MVSTSPRALDLGSGPCPAAGYVGVDLCEGEGGAEVVSFDLLSGRPWPFPSGSVERLRSSHFIEHIPHERVRVSESTEFRRAVRSPGAPRTVEKGSISRTQDAFFWFFDEAFRVAASGCRFELRWPHPQSDFADQDPTHCRRIPTSTLHYLTREGRKTMALGQYPVACEWLIEPGSVFELGSPESLAPFTNAEGVVDIAAARRCHGSFHEIAAVLIKP